MKAKDKDWESTIDLKPEDPNEKDIIDQLNSLVDDRRKKRIIYVWTAAGIFILLLALVIILFGFLNVGNFEDVSDRTTLITGIATFSAAVFILLSSRIEVGLETPEIEGIVKKIVPKPTVDKLKNAVNGATPGYSVLISSIAAVGALGTTILGLVL